MRIPRHLAVIPDGNRRWALAHGYDKKDGYSHGIDPGLDLLHYARELGIAELTYYGFTTDNTKRPAAQKQAFSQACIRAVKAIAAEDVTLFILGNDQSPAFPEELKGYANREICFGSGTMRVNFLVNYSWLWDLKGSEQGGNFMHNLRSGSISRIDLLVRWGGQRRLSGLLPVQSVYSDIYIVDAYWPDYRREHLDAALRWYDTVDVTLGG